MLRDWYQIYYKLLITARHLLPTDRNCVRLATVFFFPESSTRREWFSAKFQPLELAAIAKLLDNRDFQKVFARNSMQLSVRQTPLQRTFSSQKRNFTRGCTYLRRMTHKTSDLLLRNRRRRHTISFETLFNEIQWPARHVLWDVNLWPTSTCAS